MYFLICGEFHLPTTPQMTQASLIPSCLSKITDTPQTYNKCSNDASSQRRRHKNVFTYPNKSYQWKNIPIILENKWPEMTVTGKVHWLLHNSHDTGDFTVTHIRKALTFHSHSQTALPFASMTLLVLFPLRWTPTPSHWAPRLPKSKSHIWHDTVEVHPHWSLSQTPRRRAISLL